MGTAKKKQGIKLKHFLEANHLSMTDICNHVGRHSFGTLLGEIGYTTRFIGQAMGISERTAQRYVAITRQSMDNEMQTKGGF